MQRKYLGIGLLVTPLVMGVMQAPVASARTCELPPGFVDTPRPDIAPIEELVSHTEEVTIERSFAIVQYLAETTPLGQGTHQTSDLLPRATGTRRLTEGKFQAGTRRLVCLTDGSTVVEQVLVMEKGPDSSRFRYVVWNYTSPNFPPISYAIGEFVRTAVDASRTHVRWTYSFQPDRNRWPGSLGESGDAVFRESFVKGQFAGKMRKALAGGKQRAEELPPSFDPSKQPGETASGRVPSAARAQ